MSRLRVALVSEHADPLAPVGHPETGGQNVYVAALAGELGRLGCTVDVFTRRADPGDAACISMAPSVTVHRLDCGRAGPIPRDELMAAMPELAAQLATAWRARPPDVVHSHFWMSGWAAAAAAPPGAALVQTFHALGTVKRRHQGAADTSPPERVSTERRLLHTADAIVATCHDEIAELRRMGGDGRAVVVPCGVSDAFSPFGPIDPVPRRHRYRLATVSRIVPRKGIADVVRALAALPDTELVVVGGSDRGPIDDTEADLRRLAADLGVAGRIAFRGRMRSDAVAAVMRSADAVVCAPWYEPFGIVPVEAMACGVPVVGTAVGGLLDTVRDGTTGVLVPPQRPDELARALAALLANPARRRAMAAAGAKRAQQYRWPRVAAAVLDVYRDVVARRCGVADSEAALA